MILSHVQITNYKQYIDEHEIPIPSAATVGVIGANGVGKTTLFEAIEWCLYNPSSIAAKDIRPRGRGGFTKVVVTLDVPATGQQFLIERELKRASTQAVIYRIEPDGDETIIVQGTKQVTEHIEKTLIGLNHSAFTATFFTRQKELSFFGELGATARRREVGKLLGLETIREAQQDIAADRNSALNVSRVLKSRYEAESKGRDFTTEIASAEKTITASRAELANAQTAVDKAKSDLATAEQLLAEQQARKDSDTAIAQRLLELRGELGKANETLQHCKQGLTQLTQREEERKSLLPMAERVDTLRTEDERLNALRNVALQKRELEQSLKANHRRRQDSVTTVREIVVRLLPPTPLNGWVWSDGDHQDPRSACDRLVATLERIDISSHERTAQAMELLLTLGRDHAEAQARLTLYEKRRESLQAELDTHLKDGDPTERLTAVTARIRELQEQEVNLRASVTHIMSQREQFTGLATKLREEHFGETCPTCHRPFTKDDIQFTLNAFQDQVNRLDKDLHEINHQLSGHLQECKALQSEQTRLEERARKLAAVRQSIEASGPFIREQQATEQQARTRLANAMQEQDRTSPPTDDDLASAKTRLQAWRRIADSRSSIERSRATIVTLFEEVTTLERQITDIGDVAYDESAHNRVRQEHQQALKAQTTIIQIDRDLARRPQLEADLSACNERIRAIAAATADAEKQRAAIGFDPADLAAAVTAAQNQREATSIATELLHRVQGTLREAEHAHESLLKDQSRIAKLATDADAKQHEHDQLDQMYREFTEFERFAAAWYAPRLSDITSDLVSEVTEGKYDRIVFDNNFGIEIYDGDEEKFPLETYSGGERDVIALCARIALSRVIGNQAAHPPGFLVLDEVFGSLDRDRRSRLLEMLGAITSSGEHFRQVFMISHVDDVRTAPIFDELWLIRESADGTSELQSLAPGAEIGEI